MPDFTQLDKTIDAKLRTFIQHVEPDDPNELLEPGKDYNFQHKLWHWNDSTDEWLYHTGMCQHMGQDVTLYGGENNLVFVFFDDAVAVLEPTIAAAIANAPVVPDSSRQDQ